LTPQEHVDFGDLTKALREMIQLNQELATVKFEAQKVQKIYTVLSTVKGNIPTNQRNAILVLFLLFFNTSHSFSSFIRLLLVICSIFASQIIVTICH
jgi:hypothetical protein